MGDRGLAECIRKFLRRLGNRPLDKRRSSRKIEVGRNIKEPKKLKESFLLSESTMLTEEQKQIINHSDGAHARVLAVAGSGKTSTMVYRICHLIRNRGIKKHQIQVLMFNRLARIEFIDKLAEQGLSRGEQPHVDTFHSYAYRVAQANENIQWFGEYEGLATLELRRSIDTVIKKLRLEEDELGLEDARRAISLWKGALIRPSEAGYTGPNGEAFVSIYREFEERRLRNNAITFDDFVPLAVALIGRDKNALEKHAGPLRFVIVDEYQDINLGQERLVEILASRGADVMVVGDDDQTIYEWRGARSEYILREFMSTFDNKQHSKYSLSHSFRFGYSIAQAANNVITHNTNRNEKTLLTHDPAKGSQVTLVTDDLAPGGHANRHLVEEIVTLVKAKGVRPPEIRVLGRTYAQLNSISTEFLLQQVPFKVEGRAPFVKAGECQVLLDYIRVATQLDSVPSEASARLFGNISNKPSRFLSRRDVENMFHEGRQSSQSLRDLLFQTVQDPTLFRRESQRDNLEDLLSVLEEIDRKIRNTPELPAAKLLNWIDNEVGLQDHYSRYYGEGDESLIRIQNIEALKRYARHTDLTWQNFIDHVDRIDTTRGQPEELWIRLTTIHGTKGLEFNYVFIPDCQEGFMPVFIASNDPTFDKLDPKREPRPAEWIENERRLFYVGITRAKKGLFVGAPVLSSGAQQEQKGSQESNATPSRFIEELELEQTLAIDKELVPAARGETGHQLLPKCQQFAAYHTIIGVVKEHYSMHFTDQVRAKLATIQLAGAERPFIYKGRYDSIEKREDRMKKKIDSDNKIWDWIPEPPRTRKRSQR